MDLTQYVGHSKVSHRETGLFYQFIHKTVRRQGINGIIYSIKIEPIGYYWHNIMECKAYIQQYYSITGIYDYNSNILHFTILDNINNRLSTDCILELKKRDFLNEKKRNIYDVKKYGDWCMQKIKFK